MLRIDNFNENQVLTVTVQGKLTEDEYTAILPQLEHMLKTHGPLRFFIKLEDFSGFGFEVGALWEDMKFDYKNRHLYDKTAVVGDKKWEKWGTKISNLFFDAEMKFFSNDQEDEAWKWVND